jgi:hypothetical protein
MPPQLDTKKADPTKVSLIYRQFDFTDLDFTIILDFTIFLLPLTHLANY